MELKDAEYQEWFNQPQIDHWTNRPLDNENEPLIINLK